MTTHLFRLARAMTTTAYKTTTRRLSTRTLFSHLASSWSCDEEVDFVRDKCIPGAFAYKDFSHCWATSAIHAIEAEYTLKTRERVRLSVQELIDKCFQDHRGWSRPDIAYSYAINKGLYKYEDYPTKRKGAKKLYLTDYVRVPSIGASLVAALRKQPVVVSMSPTDSFMNFGAFGAGRQGRIFKGGYVPKEDLIHYMVAAGFQAHGDRYVFAFKNCWGREWGYWGSFVYLKEAQCIGGPLGIYYELSYPVIGGNPWF